MSDTHPLGKVIWSLKGSRPTGWDHCSHSFDYYNNMQHVNLRQHSTLSLPRHAPPTARLAFQGLDWKERISYTHLGWKSGLKPSGTCISLMSSTFSEEGASVEIGILYSYSAEHNLYVFLPCRQTNKNLKEIPLTPNRQSVHTKHECCCGRACVIYSCSRWRHSTAKAERMAVCMCEDHHRLLPMTLSSSAELRAGPTKRCSRQRKPTLVLHLSLSMAERQALL